MEEHRWVIGDQIVLREVWEGKVWSGRPQIVILDSPDLLALYIPSGTLWRKPVTLEGGTLRIPKQEWRLADESQKIETLRLVTPGASHSVLVLWQPGFSEFLKWYVNLEKPLTRTHFGFDYMDLALDIVISSNQEEWRWKDEDELREAVEEGLISQKLAFELKEEGEAVLESMLAARPPFCDGWDRWRPDPNWPIPTLFDGWDRLY